MRVVFMGTPAFAVPTLQALTRWHDVAAVYTRSDAVSGRGSRARPSAVKTAARELGLPVREPDTLRDPAEQSWLSSSAPDVIVVAAYGLILPPAILTIPPHGCINVHASLLPRWRGAAPIERAILAGDEEVGVSIMRMEEGLDTGPFATKVALPADDLSADEIAAELANAGATALLSVLEAIESGCVEWSSQDDSLATYAAKVTDADTMLSPGLGVDDFIRRVRASSRRAPARLVVGSTPMSVLSAARTESVLEAGHVMVTKHELLLGTADGAVALRMVKPDGKPEMEAAAWARGARLEAGSTWGPTS